MTHSNDPIFFGYQHDHHAVRFVGYPIHIKNAIMQYYVPLVSISKQDYLIIKHPFPREMINPYVTSIRYYHCPVTVIDCYQYWTQCLLIGTWFTILIPCLDPIFIILLYIPIAYSISIHFHYHSPVFSLIKTTDQQPSIHHDPL